MFQDDSFADHFLAVSRRSPSASTNSIRGKSQNRQGLHLQINSRETPTTDADL